MKAELRYEIPAHGAAPRHERSWDRLVARTLAPSLDRQLAAGSSARSSQALAARADHIVSPAGRRELARRWADVLNRAYRQPVPRSPRAPLRRGAIVAAEQDLRAMISVLTSGLPIDARGAAMASSLLSDGTGPLYNHRSLVDLSSVVREATRQMDRFAARAAGEHSDRAGCFR
jgi:hypothetical protein